MSDERWERIEGLFHDLLGRPARERELILEKACADDPSLRHEVVALIDADADANTDALELAVGCTASEWLHEPPSSLVGRSLGRYRVEARIATGGMGEVYRGRDERLERTVALKLLPHYLTADSDARRRLELEAKAIAALSHPHICPLFDIGSADGIEFLVMEYLEGETLAARLTRGSLAWQEALQIAIEVADGLECAHRARIVHRDLKPGNVMLTREGAKLLDFGLASLQRLQPVAGEDHANSPFGTLRYMAPEQIVAREADHRADMWAFGCVLYEMLTGRPAFEAGSREALESAILSGTPDLAESETRMPAGLRQLVEMCLAKDPNERWESAGDLKRALRWFADRRRSDGHSRAGPAEPGQTLFRSGQARAAILSVTVLGIAVAWWRVYPPSSQVATREVTRLRLPMPQGIVLGAPNAGSPVAISRDGRRVAYVGAHDGRTHLFVQSLGADEPTQLAQTEGAASPVFAPGGESLAFTAAGKLKTVSVSGGSPSTLSSVPADATLAWTSDDRLLVGGDGVPIREFVPGVGGLRDVTRLSGSEASHLYSTMLPDDGGLLFTAEPSRTIVLKRGARLKPLVTNAADAQVVARDLLVFGRAGTLWAAQLAAAEGALSGAPLPAIDGVLLNGSGIPEYAVSAEGTLVYAPDSGSPTRALVWVDRSGREEIVGLPGRPYGPPRIAPDGSHVVVSTEEADQKLWIVDPQQPTLNRLTVGTPPHFAPVWSPDGRRVFFSDMGRVFATIPDGSGRTVLILDTPEVYPTGITPDGRTLVVHGVGVATASPGSHIGAVSLEETPRLTLLVRESGNQRNGVVSPDGRWLAYQSDESGRQEVYVRPYPNTDEGRWQISVDGGGQPLWSRDGRELFYRAAAGQVVAARVRAASEFRFDAPRVVVAGSYRGAISTARSYDVAPDGRRFLLIKDLDPDASTELNMVLNWDVELRAKLKH
jgi:eukaryotic-like serine/threonine-protein kinase